MPVVRTLLALGLIGAAVLLLAIAGDPLIAWAGARQHELQNALAAALGAVRRGEGGAAMAMIGVCAAYGVIHAVGPGHGKLLISGAAFASQRTARRMAELGLLASLAQGVTAILLVYGGLGLFSLASRSVIRVSETWLAVASDGAIALIGLWLLWRGVRLFLLHAAGKQGRRGAAPSGAHRHDHAHPPGLNHDHDAVCGAGCRHGPDADAVERLETWRDAFALVAGIGIRPCSGALIVLALAWRYELYLLGAASVAGMALGTGAVVAAIALLATRLRDLGLMREAGPIEIWSLAATQLVVGALLLTVGVASALAAVDQGAASHPLAASQNAEPRLVGVLTR